MGNQAHHRWGTRHAVVGNQAHHRLGYIAVWHIIDGGTRHIIDGNQAHHRWDTRHIKDGEPGTLLASLGAWKVEAVVGADVQERFENLLAEQTCQHTREACSRSVGPSCRFQLMCEHCV